MNTDRIFVREYLESLTEKNELNVIFPFLLEAMGFSILTKPSENIGLKEYGKDIVAIGKDKDGIKKGFYFELKGGEDRDINESSLNKSDGIISSIHDAAFVDYNTAHSEFQNLPIVIAIVHNGIVKGTASNTLEGFLKKMKSLCPDKEFVRWDIDELSNLFTKHLFGPYLLSDDEIRKSLHRVLINLEFTQDVSNDFKILIKEVLHRSEWTSKKGKLPRKWVLTFETIRLIGFMIYSNAISNNNLGIAEQHLRHIVIDFWYWILKNNIENRPQVKKHFIEVYALYLQVLTLYCQRVLPIAMKKDGLYYPNGGAYEQIGYTLRTHDFVFLFNHALDNSTKKTVDIKDIESFMSRLLRENSVSRRPLLDIHSLPILDVILFYKSLERDDLAIHHIREVFGYIKFGKETAGRLLPDANNNPQNLIKLFVTGVKPTYYVDSTSLLLGMLIELTVVFNLEKDFYEIRDFAIKHNIDLALFVPHHGIKSKSKHLIEDQKNDLEEQLFSKSFQDGYQLSVNLYKDFTNNISWEDFRENLIKCKDEFIYEYRTDKSGFEHLKKLAHFTFKTPYFPDRWRNLLPEG